MSTIYTVSQINSYIKNMFANDYLLRKVQIKGELSNVKYHSSGHIYFTVKEDGSAMNGIMFKSARLQGLDFTLENGQSVVISGNVTVYERDGRYQIYATKISQDGRGNLYEAYELLKQKLYEEGLFEFELKKEIPKYPKKVGIVTASTGAALQDIRNIAKRRNPFVQLYLYPAKVQGEGAAKTIVKGIETLDGMGMDTIIIGRGGGSIEDLWAFNEEIVARAIFAANTPIISGTGHEIDTTIADYAADLIAPTPSAACELAIPDIMTSIHQLKQYEERIKQLVLYKVSVKKQRFDMLSAKLSKASPSNRLNNQKIYLDTLQDKMNLSIETKMNRRNHCFDLLLTKLNGLSPTAKLVGGYGYIETQKAEPLSSIEDVKKGDNLTLYISDGTIETTVKQVLKNGDK